MRSSSATGFSFLATLLLTSAWSPHTLFKLTSTESNSTTYTHRLLINRPVQIPCFKPDDDAIPVAVKTLNRTIYWSHRGFKLTKESSFISASWDTQGTLIVDSILPRKINLWCHLKVDTTSFLFVHRLDFVESAYVQTVFAVDMNATLVTNSTKAFYEFLYSQKSNCVIRLQGGGVSVLKGAPGIDLTKAVYQKAIIMEAAQEACEAEFDCVGVSLDYFQCSVNMGQRVALYSIDFSTMHSADVGVFVESENPDLNNQIEQTVLRLINAVKRTKGKIAAFGFGKIPRTDVKLDMYVQNRTVKMCLGVAGRLSKSGKAECELCPAGSHKEIQITLPPPPEQILETPADEGDTNRDPLTSLTWPHADDSTSCRPCPASSYAEILGRRSCLPCPPWHSAPIFGAVPGEGGEWIELVCPRIGRWQVVLNDYVTEAYGYQPVGKWFEALSELTRVWIYVVVALVPIFLVSVAVLVIYCCVDVGRMLDKAANQLRPLYLEAALVVKTTKRMERERTARAVAKLRQLMKDDVKCQAAN